MKALQTIVIVALILFAAWAVETWCDRYRPRTPSLVRLLAILALTFAIGVVSVRLVHGRDLGQWEASDPAVAAWYRALMQPDNPSASCCGEADAYWADEIHVRGGKTFAVITDDRPDEPLRRPHVDVGTEVEIPNHKLKWDRSNPTGHSVVFLSRGGYVYCFVQGTMI